MEREYRVQRLNDFMFVHNVTFFSSTDLLVIQTFYKITLSSVKLLTRLKR